MNGQQHQMILEKYHPSGAEEWYCPACGRRMTITWQPWKKIILDRGDMYASHSGSKGGLHVGSIVVKNQDQEHNNNSLSETEPFADDPYLAPWQRWLDEIDYGDL